MQHAVRTGRAHLGVSTLDVLPDDLISLPIATYPQVLLVPEQHRLARKRAVRLADLTGSELVVPPPARPHRVALERALTAAGVDWTAAVEAEGWPLTVHFAALGVGLAGVYGCVQPTAGLVARRITDLPPITFHAVHRTGALDAPASPTSSTRIRNGVPAAAGHTRRRAAPRTGTTRALTRDRGPRWRRGGPMPELGAAALWMPSCSPRPHLMGL
jgi:hypothetical protein